MNDHEYPTEDTSHWGSSSAGLHEMPPEDFEYDFSESGKFSIKSFLLMAAIFMCVIFVMFKIL